MTSPAVDPADAAESAPSVNRRLRPLLDRDPVQLMWWVLGLSLLVKLLLAAVLPLTQDEAYFTMWGEHPAFGYSEHPPMIGWWLAPILMLGKSAFLVRLPAVLVTLTVGWGLYFALRHRDPERAAWVAILFLVSPLNVLYVVITTDVPLLFFSFWSVVLFLRALREGAWRAWAGAGLLLGAAFLSKYFAVLLGLAYLVVLAVIARSRRRVLGGLLLILAALPAGILDLWWNFEHSWLHVNSNLFYRNGGAGLNPITPLLFLATALWFLLPAGGIAWWRARRELAARARSEDARVLLLLLAVPLAALAAVGVLRRVGVHWLVSFAPLAYLVSGVLLSSRELRRAARWTLVFTACHLALVAGVLALPLRLFAGSPDFATIVMSVHHEELAAVLEPHTGGRRLAAEGYGVASLLTFFTPGYWANFEVGSQHGRQDDLVTDWREWQGRDALIVCRRPPDRTKYEPLFGSVRVESVTIAGCELYLVLGDRFDLDAYRELILAQVRDSYYDVPGWLRMRRCFFRDRYFPDETG